MNFFNLFIYIISCKQYEMYVHCNPLDKLKEKTNI